MSLQGAAVVGSLTEEVGTMVAHKRLFPTGQVMLGPGEVRWGEVGDVDDPGTVMTSLRL